MTVICESFSYVKIVCKQTIACNSLAGLIYLMMLHIADDITF